MIKAIKNNFKLVFKYFRNTLFLYFFSAKKNHIQAININKNTAIFHIINQKYSEKFNKLILNMFNNE